MVTTYSDTVTGSPSVAAEPAEQRSERRAPLEATGRHRVVVAPVDVAPSPCLAARERRDDRMAGRVEMLERMRVLGVLATADVAADQADAELRPRGADREAILAAAAR